MRMFKLLVSVVLTLALTFGCTVGSVSYGGSNLCLTVDAATLSAPTNITVSSKTATSFTVKWNKVSGASAYRFYLYNSSTGKYERYKTVSSALCNVTGCKGSTKYTFKIAALVKNSSGSYTEQTLSKAYAVTTASSGSGSSSVWSGKTDTSWYTGKKDSYDISTAEQLAGLASLVNSGKLSEGIIINLTSDIYLNDVSDFTDAYDIGDWETNPPENTWTPIGRSGEPVTGYYPFVGTFNGNGHTIYGMYTYNEYAAGLFGYTYNAVIEDLRISNSLVEVYKQTVKSNGSINITDGCYAGGIAGIIEYTVVYDCQNNARIHNLGCLDSLDGMDNAYAGGIVGAMKQENLTQYYAIGISESILLFGNLIVNPLVLTYVDNNRISSSAIISCTNWGHIESEGYINVYAGGIAGYSYEGTIKNCLNAAPVVAYKKHEINNSKRKAVFGGIVGKNQSAVISNSYYYPFNSEKGVGATDVSINKGVDGSKSVTLEEALTKDFASKLGSDYVYVSGKLPCLKVFA